MHDNVNGFLNFNHTLIKFQASAKTLKAAIELLLICIRHIEILNSSHFLSVQTFRDGNYFSRPVFGEYGICIRAV